MATCAVADEALAILSSEAPDENQKKIALAAKTGFLLLQTFWRRPRVSEVGLWKLEPT